MRTVSRFVDYTFNQLSSRYELRFDSTNLDKIEIYYNKKKVAFIDENCSLKRIKFIKEVSEQEAFNIASLCSAVLHSSVMF